MNGHRNLRHFFFIGLCIVMIICIGFYFVIPVHVLSITTLKDIIVQQNIYPIRTLGYIFSISLVENR